MLGSDKMSNQYLATNIKYFRNQFDWTQQQLADKLKLSRSVIAKWESGDVLPDLPSLIKLSQLFHQTIDHLLGLNDQTDQVLSDFQQFYQANTEKELVIDESIAHLMHYLIKHPDFKSQLERMSQLSIKQQKALQRIFVNTINEIEKL